jgi:hypothetical protein
LLIVLLAAVPATFDENSRSRFRAPKIRSAHQENARHLRMYARFSAQATKTFAGKRGARWS